MILNSHAVYFLLALPLLRLRARTLAIIAAVLALVAPQVAFGLRALLSEPLLNGINAHDPLERLCGVGVLDLLLNQSHRSPGPGGQPADSPAGRHRRTAGGGHHHAGGVDRTRRARARTARGRVATYAVTTDAADAVTTGARAGVPPARARR